MARGRGERVPDEDILAVFTAINAPVVSTNEVSDAIDLGRRATLKRLNALADEGRIKRKKIDERRTIWWDPEVLAERYSRS